VLLRLRRLRLRRLRRLRLLPPPELLPSLAVLLAGAIWVNFAITFSSSVRSLRPVSPTMAPLH
jgi:hypothetical protein